VAEEALDRIGSTEPAADRDSVPAVLGRVTLTGDPATDSLALREEFHIQLIELANQFDHLDHEAGPLGGSELQDDCQAIRELTRKEMHPRFHEAFRRQQGEVLDSQILSGLVAGPDAK
jgi:hypothetical protein